MRLPFLFALLTHPLAATPAQECPPFANDYFGGELAALEDVDGDGVPDLAALAPFFGDGVLWIVSGGSGRSIRFFQGRPGHTLTGTVASAGDFDGDGAPDLVVTGGFEWVGENTPFIDVIAVADGRVLASLESAVEGLSVVPSIAVLGDLDGEGVNALAFPVFDAGEPARAGHAVVLSGERREVAFVLEGVEGSRRFGGEVAAAGDVNGDGALDILVGGGIDASGRGYARLFSGADGRGLGILRGREGDFAVAESVACLGDVNGDGAADVVLGFTGLQVLAGRAYSGRTGAALFEVHFPAWIEIEGDGDRLAPAGDLDGDGRCDVLLATPGGNFRHWGYVTAFSGADGRSLRQWRAEKGDTRFGQSVLSLGDVDGDGVPDVAIGITSPFGSGKPGEVRVFSGKGGAELYRIAQETLFGSQ